MGQMDSPAGIYLGTSIVLRAVSSILLLTPVIPAGVTQDTTKTLLNTLFLELSVDIIFIIQHGSR